MSNNNTNNKVDVKSIIIVILLVCSVATNFWLAYSVTTMHNFTMQFVSDVFYYTGPQSNSNNNYYPENQNSHEYDANPNGGYSQHDDHYHAPDGSLLTEEEYNKLFNIKP